MNEGLKFSAPNVNMHLQSVDYEIKDGKVMCIVRPARFNETDCYTRIANAVVAAHLMDNSGYTGDISLDTQDVKLVVPVDRYSYVGVARLKKGDTENVELAKQVAYKKAYRSFISYYITNYAKMYDRLGTWLDCVTCNEASDYSAAGQIEQLITRYGELDAEIRGMTCK